MLPTLGHYEVLRLLGRGGMGEVYLAWDPKLERQVAIKVLPEDVVVDAERARRFGREARAASALRHPAVAHVYEIGEQDGRPFIVMEYVEGEPLDSSLAAGPLPVAQVLEVALQAADALEEAHRHGVIHRDIKPGNVMLLPRGGIKLMDFGLARIDRPDGATDLKTTTGVVMGTVQYMSPEQALGRPVDGRSDIFSLGVTLYEIATGRLPFCGATVGETLDLILHGEPLPPSKVNPLLPAQYDPVILRCLAKSRDDRYASAAALCADLKRLRSGGLTRRTGRAMPAAGPEADDPMERLLATVAPSALRFWKIDTLAGVVLFTPVWIVLAWYVKGWTGGRLGLLLFAAVVVCQAITATLRLYLLVGTRTLPRQRLLEEIRRVMPVVRAVDLVLMAVVIVMAALVGDDHTGVAALLLGLAAAGLVKFLMADPTLTREAFSDERR